MKLHRILIATLATAACLLGTGASAQEKFITVSSTTSSEQSGLFGHILPVFEKESGIKVRIVAGHRAGARHRAPGRCRRGLRP